MFVTGSQTGKFEVVPLVVSASTPPENITRPLSVPVVKSSPVAIRLTFMPPGAPGVADDPVVSVHDGVRGLYISAELLVVNATGLAGVEAQAAAAPVRPPATSTLPEGRLTIAGSSR